MNEPSVLPPSESPSEEPLSPIEEAPNYDTVPPDLEATGGSAPSPATSSVKKGINPGLVVVLVLLVACLCFACGVLFGVWAWETGDQWFSLLPLAWPALA
jgi:hypothetical protein